MGVGTSSAAVLDSPEKKQTGEFSSTKQVHHRHPKSKHSKTKIFQNTATPDRNTEGKRPRVNVLGGLPLATLHKPCRLGGVCLCRCTPHKPRAWGQEGTENDQPASRWLGGFSIHKPLRRGEREHTFTHYLSPCRDQQRRQRARCFSTRT